MEDKKKNEQKKGSVYIHFSFQVVGRFVEMLVLYGESLLPSSLHDGLENLCIVSDQQVGWVQQPIADIHSPKTGLNLVEFS